MNGKFNFLKEIKTSANHDFAFDNKFFTDEKAQKIVQYINFLKDENQKKNLVSRKATDEDIFKHIKSSLAFVKHILKLKTPIKILDMGSGSGFPVIICAICLPEIEFAIMDSVQKKIDFLYDAAGILNLKNVECFWGRIEDFGNANGLRQEFDICTAMALGSIELTTEYAFAFLKLGGIFLTIKSYSQEEEISRTKKRLEKFGSNVAIKKEEVVSSFMIAIAKSSTSNFI